MHTLTEADAIEKCWAAIGKKVPIVVNYANFCRTSGRSMVRTKNRKTDLPWQPSFLADNKRNPRLGRRPRRG